MKFLGASLATAACLLVVQLAAGSRVKITKGNLPCDRLPINVRPTRYDLHLKFPSLDSDVYEGKVLIGVKYFKMEEMISSGMSTTLGLDDFPCVKYNYDDTIMLNADKSLEIEDIEVTSHSLIAPLRNEAQKKREISEVIRDETKQMMAIRVKSGLRATKQGTLGSIAITFRGRMSEEKRGLFLSEYKDGKKVYKHIVSQFQPMGARTVFPCFDEPRFRVPFSLGLRHPRKLKALGNTEVQRVDEGLGDYKDTYFLNTPNIPLHEVAFIIGDFDEPIGFGSAENDKQLKVNVYTVPGRRQDAFKAASIAYKATRWFEKYIEFDFPLNKLDIVAVPQLEKDNTASLGLGFVRDSLLWISDDSEEPRITMTLNVAQVVVQQWFGGLISPHWWSDLWITDGVANQFAIKAVKEFIKPEGERAQSLKVPAGLLDGEKTCALAQSIEEAAGSDNYQRVLRDLVFSEAYNTITVESYKRAMLNVGLPDSTLEILKKVQTSPKDPWTL